MANNDMVQSTLAAEVVELKNMLSQVKLEGNRRDLKNLLSEKEARLLQMESVGEPMEVEPVDLQLPIPSPVKVGSHTAKPMDIGEDVNVYTEISRFAWEDDGYGKDKVMVHIMSGVDGVGDLPASNVTCKFTKDSFDLKILGLHGKNYRLVKYHLDKEIDPKKSSIRIRKNRLSITLWKADNKNTWMNLTAKNPLKAARNTDSKDPGAGIMDMMKDLYEDGDEEMKRTIAKAWSEGREKRGQGADAF